MKILGIESSFDETAAAVVDRGRIIVSNIVASSSELHVLTGGAIPEIAAREQIKHILPTITQALSPLSGQPFDQIDAIAVTVGPGLIGSLLVGVETAKTISYLYKKPIIPINHIFAHIYANWLSSDEPQFPAIGLVVSGGHTELFFLKNHTDWKWIGGTLDDASGEAFDKTARLMGLSYPGGPAIAAEAVKFNIKHSMSNIKLPRPMIGSKDFNFSFSGLKTAVIREVKKLKDAHQFDFLSIQQLSYELQESITDVLVKKTLDAVKKYPVKSLLLGGGVAANKRLTEKFKLNIEKFKLTIDLYVPPAKLCTDNAASIASMAYFHNTPRPWKDIQAQPDFEVEV